jgi:hypothetical protein
MSGSSIAAIEGPGWSLTLDAGISISWAAPTDGARIHREEEAVFREHLEARRADVEAMLAAAGVSMSPACVGEEHDGQKLLAMLKEQPQGRGRPAYRFPLIVRVRAGVFPICTLRVALASATTTTLEPLLTAAQALTTTTAAAAARR